MAMEKLKGISRRDWFRRESHGGESALLDPIREVLPDRDTWAQEIIKETGVKVTVTELYTTSKKELLEESTTAESATQAVEEATAQKTFWGTKRKQGPRKIGSAIQSFAKNFSAFLESYSGIVEMVKTGDNQYGGLAYGTLSLLLSVAVMKQQYEEKIDSFLEQLSREFPRLEILDDVFPSTKIQSLVAKIYQEGICFARECTRYYSRSSAGRVGHTAKSPLHPIETVVGRMKEQLLEVRRESEALLQKRIRDVLEINLRMERELEAVRRQLEEKQENEDKERLDKLHIALNLRNSDSRNTDIDKYRNLLENDFPQSLRHSEPTRMTLDRLQREEMYQHWAQTENSCLFHLSGQNWSGASTNSTLLWISPAAILVAEQFRLSKVLLAYYFCQVSYHVRRQERSNIQTLACTIIYQLVTYRPELLRSGQLARSLEASLKGGFTQTQEEDVALEKMKECILEVLANFRKDDKVVLVLDRLDQCYCGREEISAAETLRCLLQILLDAPCQVKIFIVTRSTWLGTRQADRLETWLQKEKKLRKGLAEGLRYLHRDRWNQESERERSLSPASI